jgi:hypothetical protein
VALVRIDVLGERIASIIRVTRIGELGTLAVINNLSSYLRSELRLRVTANVHSYMIIVTLMMETLRSSVTSVLIRVTRRNIPEDGITVK